MSNIDELIVRIQGLEEEMQAEFDKQRGDFHFVMDKRRARFSEEVTQLQRISKVGLFTYVTGASLLSWVVAPVIYSGVVVFLLLDLFLLIYQAVCFPVYHITKASRSDYLVFDRGDLPYLNAIEKLNCLYCGYVNGVTGYAREVAARTEQFFCPIKHARRMKSAHGHYSNFFEYGDAESYRLGLVRLRENLAVARDEADR